MSAEVRGRVGYVVVEWDQAKGTQRLASYSGFHGGDIFATVEEAREIRDCLRAEMRQVTSMHYQAAEVLLLSSEDATRPTPDPDLPRFCLACGNREWEQPHVCPPSESFR